LKKEPFKTWIILNGHAGSMTGEDGPTHADPQPLQMLQNNFPKGSVVTYTPWEPQELWPLLAAGLKIRPAVLSPFVTRPAVPVPDRRKLGMPPASAAAQGVYAMRRAKTPATVVLQGCGAANLFVHEVLPILEKEGVKLNVFYVASAELFELLPKAKRDKIFPPKLFATAMGISDFTLPTLRRWVRSEAGIEASLYPFRAGEFLGSGDWRKVLEEGGLSASSQIKAVRAWVRKAGRK
jgi:transketolase